MRHIIGSNESGTVVLTFGIYQDLFHQIPCAGQILTNTHEQLDLPSHIRRKR